MKKAYNKLVKIINSSQFIAIESGSVENLINNFNNMYNNKELTESLNEIYKQKLEEYQL